MKTLCSVVLVLLNFVVYSSEYQSIRELFYEVSRENISIEKYLEGLNEIRNPESPCSKAYVAMGEFFMARESWNPLTKYEQFVKGKKGLEAAIKQDPKNIEMIYLRLCIQTALPPILNYDQNIDEDSSFLIEKFSTIKDIDLKSKIRTLLVENKYCKAERLT